MALRQNVPINFGSDFTENPYNNALLQSYYAQPQEPSYYQGVPKPPRGEGSTAGNVIGQYATNQITGGGGPFSLPSAPGVPKLLGTLPQAPNIVKAGAAPGMPSGLGLSGAAQSPFALTGIGSAGNMLLPAAGALGAYGVLSGDETSEGKGALQGGLSGAAMGSYFGPVGAIVGGAGGALAGAAKAFFNKPKTNVEQKRLKSLSDDVRQYVPENLLQDTKEKHAWYRPDLSADFIGFDPSTGNWVNNKFSKSRNVADLRPTDITGYAKFFERFGTDYGQAGQDVKEQIADEALKRGLVKEGKGTIDIGKDEEFDKRAKEILAASKGPKQPLRSTGQKR